MSCIKITDGDWSKVNVADPYTDKDGNTMFKIGYGPGNDPLYVIMGEYNTPFGASQYKGTGEPSMSCTIGNQRDSDMSAQVAGIETLKTTILEKMVKTNGYKIRGLESPAPYTVDDLQRVVSGPIVTKQKYDDKSGTLKSFEPEMRIKFPTIRRDKEHVGLVERYDENAPAGTSKGLPLIVHVMLNKNDKEVKRRIAPSLNDIEKLVPKKSRIQLVAQIRHVLFKKMATGSNASKDREGSFRIDAVRVVRLGDATVAAQAPPVMDGFDDLTLDEDESSSTKKDEENEDDEEEEEEEEEDSEGEESDASAYTKSKKK